MSVVEIPRHRQRPTIYLRTPHLHYLNSVAERDDTSLSGALAAIITSYGDLMGRSVRRVEIVQKHLYLSQEHLETLDRLAARMGITRSDMVRRLIDQDMGTQILEAC